MSTVERRKSEFREMNRDFCELEDERKTIYGHLQERIIEDGLIDRLGSRQRFFWLEKIVVVLTIAVLLVMGREMLVDDLSRPELWAAFWD